MRIVAVADTHGYEDELEAIPEGDLFIHAGDLLLRGSLDELQRAVSWLRRLPHRHKVVIAGNHDWCFARDPSVARQTLGDVATYLEDAATTIEGVRLWGSPWQPEFFGWAFNLPRGPALRERWERIPEDLGILITHGPPRGIGDLVGGEHAGCDDLLAAVRRARPALHLFGHIHEAGGLWRDGASVFANVTTAECSRSATVIDFDPAGRIVTPVDVPDGAWS
jgi:Icc-related predicted phosphoesterase